MSEEIIGLIGPLEGKGRVTRRFALIFTKNELLCVKIGGTLSLFAHLLGEALDPGYGLPTINEVYSHITNKRVDKLRKMHVKDIVDLDALNFSIPYMDIKSIEIKRKSILSPKGRRIIDIVTKSKKFWFRIVEEKAFKEGISLLKKNSSPKSKDSIN